MKSVLLIACLLLAGCAAKKRPEVQMEIPRQCIVGGILGKTKCEAISADEALCDGVRVKFECLKVEKR